MHSVALITSYIANILASPLRRCQFHLRMFPAKLLARFQLGLHPKTLMPWVYTSMYDKHRSKGKGVYVKLHTKALEMFRTRQGFLAAFQKSVYYRVDMTDHVSRLTLTHALKLLRQVPSHQLRLLHPVPGSASAPTRWQCMESTEQQFHVAVNGFQCLLLLTSTPESPFIDLGHEIQCKTLGTESAPVPESMSDTQIFRHIPCYDMRRLWSAEEIDEICHDIKREYPQLCTDSTFAIGIPKSIDTVDVAVALWQCRALLR
ncbi:uncharacterized protein BYT42DRAFT_561068 [Radiomyces spectabilis]|uniref:uncharacterized protein n=1 Tax=Radiomyces spectabilis TaxID=64574 RepID=UPI00222033AA|nr:uncharacterized protein BYT42DRAFT_561068 [Radiomyces spectabilis]KAI8388742.1 hypothetical protein BYT42DRAFT_561068 [Radiomyces spectabilis]